MKRVSFSVLEFDKKIRDVFNEYDTDDSDNIIKIKNILAHIIRNDLSERQRQIVTLYYYKNMNMIEISDMLDINVSTVCRTLSRARKNIAERMKYIF